MVELGLIISTCGQSWNAKTNPWSWDTITGIAKKAETVGFDSIWVMDHYVNPYMLDYYAMESLTVLSALSTTVKDIKLGTSVLCNVFRHPSILATIISSLDLISNGRINVGIGSGWGKDETKMLGLNWPKYSERVEMLEESLQILNGLLSGKETNFEGNYYNVNNARIGPPPVQEPHPPIWVGGSSEKMQTIAAKYGDGWLPEALDDKTMKEGSDFIKKKASELKRSPEEISIGWAGGAERGIVTKDKKLLEKEADTIFETKWWGKSISKYYSTREELPWMIGTPDECIERIEKLVKSGCKLITTGFKDFPSTEYLDLYSKTVIPYFKEK